MAELDAVDLTTGFWSDIAAPEWIFWRKPIVA
jgi:hypothetical protein